MDGLVPAGGLRLSSIAGVRRADGLAVTLDDAPWGDDLTGWATAMHSARLRPQTVELRTYHVRRLALWSGAPSPWLLTIDDLLMWTGSQDWRRETARSVRSSLRRFWAWGVATGRVEANVADLLPVIAAEPPNPRPAAPPVVRAAISAADERVRVMLRLANELGMRRGEVALVRVPDDVVEDLGGWSLHVHGKGARDRLVPLPDDLARALLRAPRGFLFPGACEGHLSARWVGRLVRDALGDGSTMHQLRHLFATEVFDETHNLRLVQEALGHASVATTQRYTRVRRSELRAAVSERSATWAGVRPAS